MNSFIYFLKREILQNEIAIAYDGRTNGGQTMLPSQTAYPAGFKTLTPD